MALPFVTVLMPVRNEAGFIRAALEAVLRQDYPADRMEIRVLDGLSTDGTREAVEALRARDPRLRLVDNPRKIEPTGVNVGVPPARGEVIVRVDGHCKIAPDYVRRCVEHLATGVDGVGGPVETIGETRTARARDERDHARLRVTRVTPTGVRLGFRSCQCSRSPPPAPA